MRNGNNTLLIVLTIAFALNHLDRHILNITLNEIGVEFQLSDLQLGSLSGLAFAVIYVLLGFPVAKLSVPGRRKVIVTSALGLWSAMTILMGLATNYLQIFLARVGVGIGEAGCVPPSHSMIADAFPKERRASALAFYSAGANVGIFLSFLIGGFVAATFGWRAAFWVAGVPGLFLAVAMALILREPAGDTKEVGGPDGSQQNRASQQNYRQLVAHLLADRSCRHTIFGAAITAMIGHGAIAWIATFLVRTHEMPLQHIGLYLAFVVGVLGACGTWLGGVLADRFEQHQPGWRLKFVAISILIAKPLAILFYLNDSTMIALLIFMIPAAVGSMFAGPTFAHLFGRVAASQRAMTTAILMFALNLVGFGLGPAFVGFLSDQLASFYGTGSLRYALVVLQLAGFWGAMHFWLAGEFVKQEAAIQGR